MMGTVPAFTTVQARRHLGRPNTTVSDRTMMNSQPTLQPPPPPNPPSQAGRVWSKEVRQYVQRAFAEKNNVAEVSKTDMEAKLKDIISGAAASNSLDSIDWDNYPLPQHIIIHERRMAASQMQSNFTQQNTNVFSDVHISKKRKSSEMDSNSSFPQPYQEPPKVEPPWRTKNKAPIPENNRSKSKDRRFRVDSNVASYNIVDANLESRKRRFEAKGSSLHSPKTSRFYRDDSEQRQVDSGPVVGRCTELEKRYFRLTSAPNPDEVRPLHILEKTLEMLKKKWKKEGNYSYICDQFKSMRQDLTVQRIKTEFTVVVYEIHARIALEKGDLGEYNQCQTQLSTLYAQKLGGHPMEFKAYRILYYLHTCNRSGMNNVLADLTQAEKQAPEIKHALSVRAALALGNYHRFFRYYQDTPNMGAYLMDMFVSRERLHALANITKAYKPDVKLRFITDELAFESDEEAARFICDNGGQEYLEEREGVVRLVCSKSAALFEAARKAAFAKIDIKGQI